MRPIIKLTKDRVPFEWTEECNKAFQLMKDTLTSPQIMALPANHEGYILDTDASLDTIGAVLSQVQDGKERVIAFGSRTLSPAERNYCVTDHEHVGRSILHGVLQTVPAWVTILGKE